MLISREARRPVTFFAMIAFCATMGYSQQTSRKTGQARIGERGILLQPLQADRIGEPVTLSEKERKRKETAERVDKEKLLYTARVVTDFDLKMLIPPKNVAGIVGKDYFLAATPPTVDFAIIPVAPKFFAERGTWSNWSQGNYDSRTGKFYSSVGDHGAYDAHLYLVEYDPHAKKVRCLPEVNRVLGRTKDRFSEGKIHGWLDFYQSKDLQRSHLWFCTYWAEYPEPNEEEYATGYEGGHIMSYDPLNGDFVDYGVPMVRASWPYHRVDSKRGILYGVGMFGEFLAWDINKQKTKWAGYLPEGMAWWVRAILVDDETGMVFTTNYFKSDSQKHFIRYDPFKNRFFNLEAHVPRNAKTGTYDHMRSHTHTRGPDGLYYAVTYSGELFTFNPETETIDDKGLNWPGEQRYTTSMDRSPKGRYLYYLPGAHGRGYKDGSPLIQYDTKTGAKKVLAFMFPYYYEKYGYVPGGTFSIKLDDKGERLFIVWNGAFVEVNAGNDADVFGHCSVMVVHIPESERVE